MHRRKDIYDTYTKNFFLENGLLASRVEIFTRYHHDSLQKISKWVEDVKFTPVNPTILVVF